MRRTRAVTSTFVALAFSLAAGTPALARSPVPPPPLNVLADPGPAPAFDASEYAGYRLRSGTATLWVNLVVDEPDGNQQKCNGEGALLFPDTAYTRWMLAKWARMLDGHIWGPGVLFPGDYATHIDLPNALREDKYEPDSDLQFGECDASNFISFKNVPAGKYIFVAMTETPATGGGPPPQTAIVESPWGLFPITSGGGGYGTGQPPGPGYVLVTRRELDVKAGHTYKIASENIYAVAHFAPRGLI
ncbi:MAG: hypothetical protein IAI49_04145 [Candidatus Eremiobacteraeota bacterium]|nr:hypothetical protein [Candidatus Eremiobacteraeota bacterium]